MFVRAAARYTFENHVDAFAVMVAFLGTSAAPLCLAALKRPMSNFLAVVPLFWASSTFEVRSLSRFATSVEKPLAKKSVCVRCLCQVDDHRSVLFRILALAQPRKFGNCRVISNPECCACSRSNITSLIQDGEALDVVHFDWIQFISKYASPSGNAGFRYLFDQVMFILIPAGESNAMGVLAIQGHRPISLGRLAELRTHFRFDLVPHKA